VLTASYILLSNYDHHAEECDAIVIKMWTIHLVEYGVDRSFDVSTHVNCESALHLMTSEWSLLTIPVCYSLILLYLVAVVC